MLKDIIVDINTIQKVEEDEEKIEFTALGKLEIKNDEYIISYEETGLYDGVDTVNTVINANKSSVTLTRSGAYNSKMLIEKGKRNTTFYSTPHGAMLMGIFGERIECELSDSGGKIDLCYTLDSQMHLISKNQVLINIREVK